MLENNEWEEIIHYVANVPRLEELIESLKQKIYKYYFEKEDEQIRQRLKAQVWVLEEMKRASLEELKRIQEKRK